MSNKDVVVAIQLLLGLMALPISLYSGYLILIHIKATELMWFLYWLLIPFTICLSILSKIVELMKVE